MAAQGGNRNNKEGSRERERAGEREGSISEKGMEGEIVRMVEHKEEKQTEVKERERKRERLTIEGKKRKARGLRGNCDPNHFCYSLV